MPGWKGSFLIAVLAGAVAVLGWAAYAHAVRPPRLVVRHLSGNVWISEQLTPAQLPLLRHRRFAAVVDLRPDGEVAGQPSSAQMASAAAQAGLAFSYDPVPHGPIPAQAVSALDQALASQSGPVLLYCRSGRRAARTWALVEASRPGGLNALAIKHAVQDAGQSADDLDQDIQARVAARPASG